MRSGPPELGVGQLNPVVPVAVGVASIDRVRPGPPGVGRELPREAPRLGSRVRFGDLGTGPFEPYPARMRRRPSSNPADTFFVMRS